MPLGHRRLCDRPPHALLQPEPIKTMPLERMSERAFPHAWEAFGIERMVECTSEAYRDAYARASGRLPARKQGMEAFELFGFEKTGCA